MKFITDNFDNNIKNICGLTDELKSLYIYNKFNKSGKSILFVCNTLYEANKMFDSLKNYTDDVLFFPMDDFITSEVLAISPDLKLSRLETLDQLKSSIPKIVVTNLMGYLRFLPPKEIFYNNYIYLKKDKEYKFNDLIEKLFSMGYKRETVVNSSGEIAIRGYVIDIFPINQANPIRIEFWGDSIDEIKYFDINTQLKIDSLPEITIMCNSEFIVDAKLECYDNKQKDLKKFGNVSSIKDFISDSLVFFNDYDDIKISYNNLKMEIISYCINKDEKAITDFMNDLFALECNYFNMCKFDVNTQESIKYNCFELDSNEFNINNIKDSVIKKINENKIVLLCVSNKNQAKKLNELLDEKSILTTEDNLFSDRVNIIVKQLNAGFVFENYVVITESEIFSHKDTYKKYKSNFKCGAKINDINKLSIGDYIVHTIYGIGKYLGIKAITKNGIAKDYLQIAYKDNDSLYVPVENIELINKYSSKEGYEPRLNKLGTSDWQKAKLRARKRASDIAHELLKLYALRSTKEGYQFDKDDDNQIQFEKEFSFTPTISQIKVMEEIKKDMESPHPMDRLLCGDVGFGKTELAFRAAFKAILSGKQVILLCPTTILSNQHYQNAIERFKSFFVNIRLLNRFITEKEVKQTIQDLKNGKVDFVIGTHKLLNESIEYKNLGLLIIDEEQRFGVKHKEKIKQYRNNIDVLSLSATPIPRTLQMSMSGVRSLSLLETPPTDRYPVQTYVLAYNEKIVKDAIYKELSRSGQAFILYNRIENIESKCKEIESIVPDAKIAYAHGRMPKKQLEDIMQKFIDKEYDVLLCTTIIETGIDIPNVNTLMVVDADYFGLSQLYQLRGRVGRTNRIAYCYLMYDSKKALTEIATKRLNAIKEFTELGSGLSVAMRDLSLRGAGDILGSEQAGFVDSVGIELFTKILKEEIDKLNGKVVDEDVEVEQPLIDVDSYVDDKYVKEEELKIEIHQMINEIDCYEKLISTKSQIEDRFGKISEYMLIYMYEQWFEKVSKKVGIKRIKQTNNQIEVIFEKEISQLIDGEKLFINALNKIPGIIFGMSFGSLIIKINKKKLERHFIYYLIDLAKLVEEAI